MGFDGVVTLPPYYYRQATQEGLYAWFSQLIEAAVPLNCALFGYHIPRISGVALPIELLERLKDAYPRRFSGIKDSSSDPDFAKALGKRFGRELIVLNGNDRLLGLALENAASGCITAMANLVSPQLRQVWDAFQLGERQPTAQAQLEGARQIFENYPPAAPTLKFLIAELYGFPSWGVRLPLLPPTTDTQAAIWEETRRRLPFLLQEM